VIHADRLAPENDKDAIELLRSVLRPGELATLAEKMYHAKQTGQHAIIGIEFTRGHARKIVYYTSELLKME